MSACPAQAHPMKGILNDFATSIGLNINFHKSTLILMNCEDDLTNELANISECKIGNMPFTYLGLPLGTNKPSIEDLMSLVCSVEQRLTSTLSMMSYGAKLSQLNTVITSLTIFALCTLKFPPKILDYWIRFVGNVCGQTKQNRGRNVTIWLLGIGFVAQKKVEALGSST